MQNRDDGFLNIIVANDSFETGYNRDFFLAAILYFFLQDQVVAKTVIFSRYKVTTLPSQCLDFQ